MAGIPFTKIMIDTRYKTKDSVSNSNFKYQLNRTGLMPEGSTFCIDDINIPYSWNTIEPGINDKLYISYRAQIADVPIPRVITITPLRYTGTEFADNLTAQLSSMGGIGTYLATYNANSNTITLTSSSMYFKIWTDDELQTTSIFGSVDTTRLGSVNEILQVYGIYTGGAGGYAGKGVGYRTGFLNLMHYQDLYLTSANLGNFQTMGARGEHNTEEDHGECRVGFQHHRQAVRHIRQHQLLQAIAVDYRFSAEGREGEHSASPRRKSDLHHQIQQRVNKLL